MAPGTASAHHEPSRPGSHDLFHGILQLRDGDVIVVYHLQHKDNESTDEMAGSWKPPSNGPYHVPIKLFIKPKGFFHPFALVL